MTDLVDKAPAAPASNSEESPTARDPQMLAQSDRHILATYWRSRGVGEMGAERYFLRVIGDLVALGAPAPLISRAERARHDEAKHGRWGRDWAVFFGHPDASDPVATRTRELTFPGASPQQNSVLRIVFLALMETVGCHVLTHVRPRIFYPALRENNQRHLADEVQHARVGWGYLFTMSEWERKTVTEYLPHLLELLPGVCCDGPERSDCEHLVPWGYLTPQVLRAGYDQALVEVIVPGLEHLGLLQRESRRVA